ncbi:MAG TPA: CoA pyrophosphatase [Kofleriaceae bacterium]|nr:CoA pyrophosphatase [Kofleriaceae bacterium]
MTHAEVVAALEALLPARARVELAIEGYRPAAVALLLVDRGGAPHVPFIVRPEAMRAHSGQIALPGGVRDPDDRSFADTARREAFEELGIAPEHVRVLGMLDDVPTPTRFVITPVVGVLTAPCDYLPNPHEVAQVFEAPLATFADRDAAEDMGEREHWGVRYQLRAYPYESHRIWGATARVLESLFDLLRPV